jgi:2-oxoglutarate ferredoxin oxidoreductase subunit gamma
MRYVVRDPVHVRLTGAGGQGVITAGVILAEAGLGDGKNVVQTQSYGPEARLGASKAEVIISSRPIAHPEVSVPDVLLCLSRDAAAKSLPQVHETTVILLDDSAPESDGRGIIYRLPLVRTALEGGNKAAANIVALWALNTLVGLVSPESLRAAIYQRLPARFRSGSEQAIQAAQRLVGADMAPVPLPASESTGAQP